MRATDIPELGRLSKSEKILFVEDFWDDIAADDSDMPVPQSHKDELDRRVELHTRSPGKLLSLCELQNRIEKYK